MGMTTNDLVTISNRLKSLDKEREFRAKVAEVAHGFTWIVKNKREFTLTDAGGHVYEVAIARNYSRQSWSHQCHEYANVTISKPGTRFKPRKLDKHGLRNDWDVDEISSACPEGSKYLYRMMRDIKNGKIE
jgi:hypothetical protein